MSTNRDPGFTHWPTSLWCWNPPLSQLHAMLSGEEETVKGITYVNIPKNVTDNNYLRVIVKNTESWIRLPKGGAWESLKNKNKNRTPRVFLWGKFGLDWLKSLSRVQLCDPMDCSLPGSSVHGISQARILQQVASLESTNSPTFTTSDLYLISFIFTPRQKILSLILLPQRKDQIKIIPIFKFLLIQEKTNKQ